MPTLPAPNAIALPFSCLVGKWSWVRDEIAFRFSICPPYPLRMRSHFRLEFAHPTPQSVDFDKIVRSLL
ncbi:MAG: hypothetical protein F6K63_34955 [Moorea sp. SIO1G6]|uniref:hypothetical protein n=1 Tax=Moorena sp. SIO1G6 TaxID=2607840 RepID=UPI0013C04322|nr:hypothetical protein [Moorena sp. SIO1G6]NES86795.1 hypothetical protein [Moorena sp. SIO2B7]NET69311.1 hypothetical protein [Moorena sp. SIO1G6]